MVWKFCWGVITLSLMATTIHAERLLLCNKSGDLSKRCSNGHLFMPSSWISSPFLTTDLKSGIQAQKGNVLDISSKPYQNHEALTGGVNYQLQIGVLDWLAVSGQFHGGFVSGLGGDVINFGAGTQLDYSLGTRFLLWKNQRFVISSSVNFVGTGDTGLDLLKFAGSASDLAVKLQTCFNDQIMKPADKKAKRAACASINKALTRFDYELGFNAEISMAMGINPVAGLLANLGYQQLFRSKTDASNFKGQVYGGFAFSLDISPVTPVPLGFLLGAQYGYRLDNRPDEFLHVGALTLHGGLFYTGSRSLSVGLEVSDEIAPVGIGPIIDRSQLFLASLSFHYYWN